ncbi:aminomethyl-transferring glycine dehydrogenase [Spirulina major CS-329]|uniref:aminomethyl-transferring glycine dehydrogenase n=1 Tax=Spirulina TaxID=1154 RepID=UPI00232EF2F1|nr:MULTISPECIES: aminomethyl-transferring glycine dehydrogenase [Spirulina]MDB9493994.1 aminomethyl-transferring glycine dehydrogenase [Spirulina subsalsa CS-330]MDB9502433.1 aminomethyl-transferring glycine dehydrogenase [Spirulina major CS-329]
MPDLNLAPETLETPLLGDPLGMSSPIAPRQGFAKRHIGITPETEAQMVKALGYQSVDELIYHAVPQGIRLQRSLHLPPAKSEHEALASLKAIAAQNQVYRSLIGMGYHACITPPVIQRNILENPGWYTAYTPYQAEIAQGRLEALLNFQTMIIDLTGLDIANASLLDEGTAAAEAMTLSYGISKNKSNRFFISEACHPQTIDVVMTRAQPLGIEVIIGDHGEMDFTATPVFGALLQYPTTDGIVLDYRPCIERVHGVGGLVTLAADPLALALLTPPGELGADIAVGSTQRLGVPLGFGGPHAAYFATKEAYKRQVPGRIVGVSRDAQGQPALRLALQTREQHIRRDKATSNICTAQVLLAVIASMYAVYHGPDGLKAIAQTIHDRAVLLAAGLRRLNYSIPDLPIFDSVCVGVGEASAPLLLAAAAERGFNLRLMEPGHLVIACDELTTEAEIETLWRIFANRDDLPFSVADFEVTALGHYAADLTRTSAFLQDPIFNSHHSETELLRYLHHLEQKDLSLTTSMIPLGSCTMKLNAAAEMFPVTWPEFGQIHPFAPRSQTQGYQTLFEQLETWLAEITGFAGVSLQPNAGSQGEYAGLQVIRAYHRDRGDLHRNICLIPESAHGTNPASAVMCGMKVVPVQCDKNGDIDRADLTKQLEKHRDNLAALMVTYPSTHGVFEAGIDEICALIHAAGGQVYMDGANMNAQVGLCRPGDFGADVCHLNLHKTFCIPHGGGGPGVGPIGVAAHLLPYLPGHPIAELGHAKAIGAIAAAPWGSASILVISWMYIAMMGAEGLTDATKISILSANYIAQQLDAAYPILFKGASGLVAHECIIDLRPLKKHGIEVDDIAKRLMDYGFHAPTMSWPVIGTMMIEPTESESLTELDRFCTAMLSIRAEAEAVIQGNADPQDNPLKHAPHTAPVVICGDWNHAYSREVAAYPAPWLKSHKFWPTVGRVDNAYGDRNLVCSCVGMDAYTEA